MYRNPTMPNTCRCSGCVRSKAWTERIEVADMEELKELINEMRGLICDLEADLDWLRTKEFRKKLLTETKNSAILKI